MSYYLFLDDERFPAEVLWVHLPRDRPFEIVRDYAQFVEFIETHGVPDFVSFDHDLCEEHYGAMLAERSYTYDDGDMVKTINYGSEPTGFDCATWLVEYCQRTGVDFPAYEVHSMNMAGKDRIDNYVNYRASKGGRLPVS